MRVALSLLVLRLLLHLPNQAADAVAAATAAAVSQDWPYSFQPPHRRVAAAEDDNDDGQP
jgi:hypothetical protein